MKLSQAFLVTQRDNPRDAEIVSHQLMSRANLIKKHGAGLYSYLPFLTKSYHKLTQIIREELDAIGWQEIIMPFVTPAELWKETGRWDLFQGLMLQFKDRKKNDFCLGPTHEEVVTDIVRSQVNSHKQLPLTLYQMTPKFRDETRPRFGLMRAREFVMMDGYSFHPNREDLDKHYEIVAGAYEKIFNRCGLKFARVEADTGAIGGTGSHEYQVLAGSGEDAILICPSCRYAANVEKAETPKSELSVPEIKKIAEAKLEEIETPTQKTIDDVSRFLGVQKSQNIKTLVYKFNTQANPKEFKLVVSFVLGHRELNLVKLKSALTQMGENPLDIVVANEEDIKKLFSCDPGFLGPRKAPVEGCVQVFDSELVGLNNLVCGANRNGYHLKGLSLVRDVESFQPSRIKDIVNATSGDPCPKCFGKGKLELHRGIEVGHIFKLGDKYSKAMDAKFQNDSKTTQIIEMGTYGIGVTRILAACIEQNHDADGMIWPVALAPYQVAIVALGGVQDAEVARISEQIYSEFKKRRIDVVLDDRDLSPGVKFKDCELLGIPYRIVVGKKGLQAGELEFGIRRDKSKKSLPFAASDIEGFVKGFVNSIDL
jgi:prolyl-tRNA synthetase